MEMTKEVSDDYLYKVISGAIDYWRFQLERNGLTIPCLTVIAHKVCGLELSSETSARIYELCANGRRYMFYCPNVRTIVVSREDAGDYSWNYKVGDHMKQRIIDDVDNGILNYNKGAKKNASMRCAIGIIKKAGLMEIVKGI